MLRYKLILLTLCLGFSVKVVAQTTQGEQGDTVLDRGFIERVADGTAPDSLAAQRNKELAELAFDRQDYAEALRNYEHVYLTYPTAVVLYNMALCYREMERIDQAILHYERALLLEPTMQQARHNLRLLYATTKDGLSDGRALPFWDNIAYAYDIDTWSVLSLVVFTMMLLGFMLFRLGSKVGYRRLGFYATLLLLFVWVFILAMIAHQYYYRSVAENRAIVTTIRQELKPTPTGQGNSITTLHEGTAVLLQGQALGHWQEVLLGDGRRGWLPQGTFTKVLPEATQLGE